MGISSGIAGAVGALPAGSVIPFAGTSAPANWLLCYGQAISRTNYSALFSAIGTTYGSGDGSTTFNVPDLRGRVIAGIDNMGGSAASRLTSTTITGGGDAAGEVGGSQTHTLSTSEMPSHTHTQNSHSHTVKATNGWVPIISNISVSGGGTGFWTWTNLGNSEMEATSTTPTNQNTGGGGAHNNVQPTMVMNYIIKATAL